jgi:type IV fimbrial biogenesis protein FimT
MHTMKRQQGATLLELMIALAVVGMLAAAGLPSMFQWLANVRLRGGADGLQNAMRLAQVEAIRRNSTVSLVLTNDAAPTASSTAVSTGRNWVLKDSAGVLIQAQGSQSSFFVQTPTPSSFAGTIVFNALGGNNLAGNTLLLTFSRSPAQSGDHPMAVLLTKGGRVRMCDPARTTGAGDPEACE